MKQLIDRKQQIFKIGNGIMVPDGTRVFPIMDPRQQKEDNIPIIDELSLAYGELDIGVESSIHIHPICTQLTYVLSGELEVKMKMDKRETIDTLQLKTNEAVVSRPACFFQLKNSGHEVCKVLYQCTPGFVFELDDQGNLLYNDAIVLSYSWEELKKMNWRIPELMDIEAIRKQREEAVRRLKG